MNVSTPRIALVLASALAAMIACGDDRTTFESPPPDFGRGDSPDGGCPNVCSLDGRAVVSCTGEVIETCPTELACGGGRCREQCAAAAIEGSSNGCEFYLQTPRLNNFDESPHSCFAAYVVNTSTQPVEIGLEYEGKTLDLSKALFRTDSGTANLSAYQGPLSPGDGVILFVSDRPVREDRPPGERAYYIKCPEGVVPALVHDYYPTGTQYGSSFRLKTTMPVSAASIYPFGGARSLQPAATLLLPVSTWTKQSMLVNAWSANYLHSPGVQIVASEDDTDVTILPRRTIQDAPGIAGSPAGTPVHYKLHGGQFLQLVQNEELTGSIVTSTKPTSFFTGHVCMTVPNHRGPCDIASQQVPGYEQWGSEYVGVGYRPRRGDEHEPVPYRIVAARDGTRLDYDPTVPVGAPLSLSAGEVAEFAAGTGDAFVVRTQDAEHPIYVAAYMSSSSANYWGGPGFNSMGDPDFVNVVSTSQYLNRASFYADPTYTETSLVLVRAKHHGEFKEVTLECLGGPVPGFQPVGARGEYEWTRVDIANRGRKGVVNGDKFCYYGAHHLKSDGPFTATLWGWDITASYAYPSGMATRKLVDGELPR